MRLNRDSALFGKLSPQRRAETHNAAVAVSDCIQQFCAQKDLANVNGNNTPDFASRQFPGA